MLASCMQASQLGLMASTRSHGDSPYRTSAAHHSDTMDVFSTFVVDSSNMPWHDIFAVDTCNVFHVGMLHACCGAAERHAA